MLALHSASLSFAGSAMGAPVRANMVATSTKKEFCYGARQPRTHSHSRARTRMPFCTTHAHAMLLLCAFALYSRGR